MEAGLKEFVDILISWGPLGVLLLGVVDSAGLPLPAGVDALVVLLVAANPGQAYLYALTAVLGSTLGNYALYAVARKGGRAYLDARTRTGRAAQFREWFLRYGLATVFIPAVLPIPLPMKIFVLSAGALGVRPPPFLGVVIAARVIRYGGLAWLGADLLTYIKQHPWHVAGFAAVLFAALYVAMSAIERHRINSAI
ncbi:MAG: VTT domain-containing protein [Acidobacteria bacterium]|nr:VTT domain-containing protein [Acidobacteriota bacterium]